MLPDSYRTRRVKPCRISYLVQLIYRLAVTLSLPLSRFVYCLKKVRKGMRNTFKVLFYIKKNAPLRNGNTPIMGRITINGQRTQLSTQLWDGRQGAARLPHMSTNNSRRFVSASKDVTTRCFTSMPWSLRKWSRRCISATTSATKRCWPSSGITTRSSAGWWASAAAKRPTINIGVFTSISKTTSTTNSTARICCSKNSTKSS